MNTSTVPYTREYKEERTHAVDDIASALLDFVLEVLLALLQRRLELICQSVCTNQILR